MAYKKEGSKSRNGPVSQQEEVMASMPHKKEASKIRNGSASQGEGGAKVVPSMPYKKEGSKSHRGPLSQEEKAAKVNELRSSLGPLSGHTALFCSESCLSRYLKANNWSLKKAKKMLKETNKWREQYKPEDIKWEDVIKEAETGRVYRANFNDREGRTVLVLRAGVQNNSQLSDQIRYLVYCMENAIINLPPSQEQMVWLIDFEGWNLSAVPIMAARETAHVLQDHYPERLAYAILYNTPKIFETFWNITKPFLDPVTQKKVKFVFSKEEQSVRLMETLFDADVLESRFGGRNLSGFDMDKYVITMKEGDVKTALFWQDLSSLCLTSDGAAPTQSKQ